MPFEPFVTAVIEGTLNTLINDNPDSLKRLNRLKGRTIQLHLKELNKTLTFIFSHQVDVLADYDGEPDCYLSLQLSVLPELKDQANITQLIKQDKLVLTGDIQLAQKFAQLLGECKPNIEEWLSRVTGDVVAHSAVSGVKSVTQSIVTHARKHQRHLGQVVTEEWRLAPTSLELTHYCDQVDQVKSQAARLEAKLTQILEKL
ncbi:ubiquinone biosynthesis accessory factor UbiJ [Vibrio palustris]|uniref:Ubiquinone biosynthesis accessory factor UbiJ n=1 Tax=Vibrio palustris TaxID=1918946 RepID=A0A1R4B807_9VIBR|nr:SCP2 domain-containing protein [Vibrio palustris]SJL85058.1 SCP-2 sterol transfer family protein [Vibrio palustris]